MTGQTNWRLSGAQSLRKRRHDGACPLSPAGPDLLSWYLSHGATLGGKVGEAAWGCPLCL
jgi:hypothetical protein